MRAVRKLNLARPLGFSTLAIAVLGLAACDDATGPDTRSLFHLEAFQGQPVPVQYDVGVEIVSGELAFGEGGGCLRTQRIRVEGAGVRVQGWACRWRQTGSTIVLHWSAESLPAGDSTVATLDGDVLEVPISTNIVCVRAPCPTSWTETYRLAS